MKRLDEIRDSDNMLILKSLPQAKCHQLVGDKKGQWAVDLEHPYRLIFEPIMDFMHKQENGSLDLEKITSVRIVGVEDYHG